MCLAGLLFNLHSQTDQKQLLRPSHKQGTSIKGAPVQQHVLFKLSPDVLAERCPFAKGDWCEG